MKWGDIDLDAARWTVPVDDAKNRREHVVPLVDAAVEMLREHRKAAMAEVTWVFTSSPVKRSSSKAATAPRD